LISRIRSFGFKAPKLLEDEAALGSEPVGAGTDVRECRFLVEGPG